MHPTPERRAASSRRAHRDLRDGRRYDEAVASNVVNLNKFRKKKQRAEKAKQAEANRIKHGRTGAEKERERLERERAARVLEGKRLGDEDP